MNIKRKLLSQNFIKDPTLAAQLIGMAGYGQKDQVIDIGAGRGVLTSELAKVAGKVIAVEIDPELGAFLKRNFSSTTSVEVAITDVRQFLFPVGDYKVFANIPFHMTADIIYKLLYYSNPPLEAYLVLPKSAAQKFSGIIHETQFSILAKPWFEFQKVRDLSRSDFQPEPDIDVTLLKITRRPAPLITNEEEQLYKSFVKFAFGAWKKNLKKSLNKIFTYPQWKRLSKENNFDLHAIPTDLSFDQWLSLFRFLVTNNSPKAFSNLLK